jgi:Spy/CpxP family protein refolding chaperone
LLLVLAPLSALAQPQVRTQAIAGPGPQTMGLPPMFDSPLGIPPQVAAKLGIPQEKLQRIKDMGFDANEALIPLEADLKRAQLALQRLLSGTSPDERAVMQKLEAASQAELAIRKNRMGLMLRIRALLGPELWNKLQAELPPLGEDMLFMGGPGERRVRIIKRGPEGAGADELPPPH